MRSRIKVGDPFPLPTKQSTPVFIVGMNGSGTSMLADCLGRHPDMFASYFETRVFPYFLLNIERYGDLNNDESFLRLWEAVLRIPVMTQINRWVPLDLPSNWRDFPRSFPSIIDAIFTSMAHAQNKKRWAEKTPQHLQHLELLSKSFPRAKFIHIVRDGRDCAASFHRRWRRTPEYTIYRWKHALHEGRLQSSSLGDRYFELTYENVTSNPEKWLRQICDFIDLPFHEAILHSSQPHMEGIGRGTSGLIQPNSNKWKSYFDNRQIAALENIAGATLSAYGYETVFEKGDNDPNAMLTFFWKWRDRFREFYDMGSKKLSGQSKKTPWSRIFHRALTSIKQSRTNRF